VLTDFEEVTSSISSWGDWCRAWSERAALHEQMGREALGKKKFLSAGEHFNRAGGLLPFRQVSVRARSRADEEPRI
jgi:hypothetical protein